MGESIFEGTITKWLKSPAIKSSATSRSLRFRPTKSTRKFPPFRWRAERNQSREGKTVPIQTVVGVIDAAGDGAGAAKSAAPAQSAHSDPSTKGCGTRQDPSTSRRAPKSCRPRKLETCCRGTRSRFWTRSNRRPSASRRRTHPTALHSSAAWPRNTVSTSPASPYRRRWTHQQARHRSLSSQWRTSLRRAEAAEPASQEFAQPRPTLAPQRAAAPPPPPPATSGGQTHVAFESAVPREKMYFGNYEVQPMSIMRQRIAEHMIASKHVSPHVYSVDEIDMSKVASLRAKSRTNSRSATKPSSPTLPFFVKAAVAGLRAYPP